MRPLPLYSVVLLAALGFTGCDVSQTYAKREASPLLRQYGCGSCHTIPGVPGANASVGPPLDRMGSRTYIAGTLPNTPENLALWIQHPQEVRRGTAMPEMNVTPEDAKKMTRYLETLY